MSSLKTKVFFRADGNSEIGLGHVVRCLALVEMIKNDFDCIFLIRTPNDELIKLIESYCKLMQLKNNISYSIEALEINEIAGENDMMVIDGYHFDSYYQKTLKSFLHKLVTIDDEAKIEIYADLVINQGNPNIAKSYKRKKYTKLLLGTDYLLVRQPFLDAIKLKKNIIKIDSLFICMGGADPFNITSKMLSAALQLDFLNRIIIVTGIAYKHKSELSEQIKSVNKKQIIWEQNINSEQMISLLNQCEIAASTASSIAMEIACVKAGMLIGTVAENQTQIHDQLISNGCAISANDFKASTIDEIKTLLNKFNNINFIESMIENQSKLIDGNSGNRILSAFKELAVC